MCTSSGIFGISVPLIMVVVARCCPQSPSLPLPSKNSCNFLPRKKSMEIIGLHSTPKHPHSSSLLHLHLQISWRFSLSRAFSPPHSPPTTLSLFLRPDSSVLLLLLLLPWKCRWWEGEVQRGRSTVVTPVVLRFFGSSMIFESTITRAS